MNLVTLQGVSKQFSERVLLDQVELLINQGDRVGLIGINGSGKTTLLRMIAGLESVDEGELTVWGGVKVQVLSQDPDLNDELTVLDQLFSSESGQMQLLLAYERVTRDLGRDPGNKELQEKMLAVSSEMDRTGGWAAEANAKSILTRLGITGFDRSVSTLSGGERKRVALARALIDPADLLILDEPTNHIDADTIAWLEEYLLEVPSALLMVTHDRYFLERIVNKIVELDRRKLVTYPGNYTRYLELRTRRHEELAAAEEKHRAQLRRELEWLRKGVMARGTKQKARKQRVVELERIQYDLNEDRVSMALASRRLGKKVLDVQELSKAFDGQPVFTGLNFYLSPGDRIGIIGPNGAGKSTFLDILAGKLAPDSGSVEWGETVHVGYYDQEAESLDEGQRAIEFIEDTAPLIRTPDGERVDAARMLEWFLFPRPQQRTRIASLSGGERRRLYLLHALALQPNVILLDEPTNDLDIQTLTVLETFLDRFRGCLVAVSHDRYFLDRNVDFLVSFEGGELSARYPTPYETFRRLRQNSTWPDKQADLQASKPQKRGRKAGTEGTQAKSSGLTWKERQEFKALELKIENLESQKAELEAEMQASGRDYERLQTLMQNVRGLDSELETALERWIELSERKER